MGDWIYYVTCISLGEIAKRVSQAEELHQSESLNELIQRELTDRSKLISTYLLSQEQRFFNAIIVGVYGGNPEWLDIALLSSDQLRALEIDETADTRISDTLGLLKLTGTEELFAIDGQHRVEAIKQAIGKNRELADEEVTMILVGHKRTPEGMERTRRLFSTLNRYAKPVTPGEIIALDEDDAFAIVTRRLVDEHDVLKGRRASPEKQARMHSSNTSSLTTILAVYDVTLTLTLKAEPDWTKPNLTRLRPPEPTLEALHQRCDQFWSLLADHFEPVREVRDSPIDANIAGKYRHAGGGHLLFRPIGLMAFARAVRTWMDRGATMEHAIGQLAGVPLELTKAPWPNVLWNPGNNTMETAASRRDLAAGLLLLWAGGPVDRLAMTRLYQKVKGDPEATLTEVSPR